jgi:phosphoesterase RecJ-like protein
MTDITLKETADFLRNAEDVCILIHQSPDGDCIGAGYALKSYFENTSRRVKVVCSDEIPDRYSFLTTLENEDFEPKTIMSVDIADKVLIGDIVDKYDGRIELSIDHHEFRKPFAKMDYVCKSASSSCEVLYEIFKELDFEINEHMAICLYTGIATDTGCFQFSNAKSRTHQITAHIMQKYPDINYAKINRKMFAVKSIERMQMEKIAIDLMETFFDGKCSMICITYDMLESLGLDGKDLEGVANIPLQLETAQVGITIKEREKGFFKISVRSADDVNAAKICEQLGGGGHAKAAGCALSGTIEEVKAKLLEAVKKGIDNL